MLSTLEQMAFWIMALICAPVGVPALFVWKMACLSPIPFLGIGDDVDRLTVDMYVYFWPVLGLAHFVDLLLDFTQYRHQRQQCLT